MLTARALGSQETSVPDLSLAEVWLPDVRSHRQHFVKPAHEELEAEDVQMDEERLLELDPSQGATSAACRLDFGKLDMSGVLLP